MAAAQVKRFFEIIRTAQPIIEKNQCPTIEL